jgi:hypothetical protein
VVRRENPNLGIFIRDPIAGNLERERANLLRFQIARIVLRDDHTAGLHVREQLGLPGGNVVLRVIGPNAKNDRVETLQIFGGNIRPIQNPHGVPDLLKALRNVVARAGNVANEVSSPPDIRPHDFRFG